LTEPIFGSTTSTSRTRAVRTEAGGSARICASSIVPAASSFFSFALADRTSFARCSACRRCSRDRRGTPAPALAAGTSAILEPEQTGGQAGGGDQSDRFHRQPLPAPEACKSPDRAHRPMIASAAGTMPNTVLLQIGRSQDGTEFPHRQGSVRLFSAGPTATTQTGRVGTSDLPVCHATAKRKIAAPERTPSAATETATASACEAPEPEATRAAAPAPTCVAAQPVRSAALPLLRRRRGRGARAETRSRFRACPGGGSTRVGCTNSISLQIGVIAGWPSLCTPRGLTGLGCSSHEPVG
jgi:hypothetical protein